MSFVKKLFKHEKKDRNESLKMHSPFRTLIALQYRDKSDMSWTKETKTIIQKIVFSVIKFVLVAGVVFGLLTIIRLLFSVTNEILNYYLVFLGIYVVLNLFTVTFGLMKSLYFAEDNKVLVTYPVSSGKLFLSKIIVYQIFEFKRSLSILLPATLGFAITAYIYHVAQIGVIFWCVIPLAIISIVTVLLGAILSIAALYIYKFFARNPVVGIILLIIVVGAAIFGLVTLINLIPVNTGDIDLVKQFPIIKSKINNAIVVFSRYVYPISYAFKSMFGETGATYIGYKLTPAAFGRFGIVLSIAVVLFFVVYFVIKPFYFNMMTKNFEFEKKVVTSSKKNKPKNKYFAFISKELKLVFRDIEISGSYLCVYILAPILLLFIDRIFMAMNRSADGNLMVFAINFLLMTLPLLASSTIISTIYSREGRAAYIKKTKPVKPYFPLLSKLIFNLVLCIPSIVVSAIVFSQATNVNAYCAIAIAIAVLGLQYGHIFISAALDIMNPQNEVYATEGTTINNPNEIKSTVIAFVISIIFALIGYVLVIEAENNFGAYNLAFTKLMLIGIVFMIGAFILFILKIKAFYIDRQEASKEWKNQLFFLWF